MKKISELHLGFPLGYFKISKSILLDENLECKPSHILFNCNKPKPDYMKIFTRLLRCCVNFCRAIFWPHPTHFFYDTQFIKV
jgi:hypothetical protein